MFTACALLAATFMQAPQGKPVQEWIPARPVTIKGLDKATCAVATAPWIAFVEVLPMPDHLQSFHAPRPPWRLVRVALGGVPEVIAESAAVRGGGWGAPSILAVDVDGTVTASWRPGHEVLIAPPNQKAVLHRVPYDGSRDCVGLSTSWIVHRDRSGALLARGLTVDGPGEDTPLGATVNARARSVFGEGWFAWVDDDGGIAAIDVARLQRRSIPLAAKQQPILDGVFGGRLLMHAEGEHPHVHVVDLDAEKCRSLPAPPAVRWCVPEGAFVGSGLWDPVAGSFLRLERLPTWPRISRVLRLGQGVLWVREQRGQEWHEVRLQDGPVAMPAGTPLRTSPEVPAQPAGDDGDAARAAWQASRGNR